MERTKPPRLDLPDVINHTISKNFTMVPNELINHPDISTNAFKVYCILISNPEGWRSHKKNIYARIKCGLTAIDNALQELEQMRLILRVQVRNKRTKQKIGSFLSVTDVPGQFVLEDTRLSLDSKGLELYHRNYNIETQDIGSYNMGSNMLNNTEYNKKENNNTQQQSNGYITKSKFESFWKIYPRKNNRGKAEHKWNAICRKPPKERPKWSTIKRSLLEQIESEQWQNEKYIPHPTTWLNQNRWLDDASQMKAPKPDHKPGKFTKGAVHHDLSRIKIKKYKP